MARMKREPVEDVAVGDVTVETVQTMPASEAPAAVKPGSETRPITLSDRQWAAIDKLASRGNLSASEWLAQYLRYVAR